MASFERRTWKDRIVEYANRYKMTDTDTGEVTYVNLNRYPGTVTQSGDAVSADSLNDLEDRIENGINAHDSEVQEYVTTAQNAAAEAANGATSASSAASQAASSATSANTNAAVAKSSAQVAQNESTNAGKSADAAALSALSAQQAAGEAADSAKNVEDMSNVSQSYAIGGTGTRDGEDSDNSKYYCEQAKLAAEQAAATHDGVASWNGRGGNVVPASGDYTASMITTSDGSTVEDKLSQHVTIDVDQTYSATSTNAQSGTAVAEAVSGKADKDVATTTANGLMSAADKTKLDKVASDGGVNTFNGRAGSVEPQSGDYTADMVGAATAEDITDAINGVVKSVSITGKTVTVTLGDGTVKTYTTQDTTYSSATTSAAGLMSASDKSKLDGIASGANAYTLPTATSSVLGGVKTGSNITNTSGTISLTKANVTSALGYTPPTTNTTYGVATSSANGLMSSTDKAHHDAMYTEVYTRPSTRKLSTQTLTTSGGTLTWTDSCITDDSLIDVYTSIPNIAPSEITQSGTTVTVTFDAQDEAFSVAIVVMN